MPAQKTIRLAIALGIVGFSATVAYGQLGVISSNLVKPETSALAQPAPMPSNHVHKAISDGTVTVVKPVLTDADDVTETRVDLKVEQPILLAASPQIVEPSILGFAAITPDQATTLPFVSVPDVIEAPSVLSFTDDANDDRSDLGSAVRESEEAGLEIEPVLTPRPFRPFTTRPVRSEVSTRKVTRNSLRSVWFTGAYR